MFHLVLLATQYCLAETFIQLLYFRKQMCILPFLAEKAAAGEHNTLQPGLFVFKWLVTFQYCSSPMKVMCLKAQFLFLLLFLMFTSHYPIFLYITLVKASFVYSKQLPTHHVFCL